MKTMALAVLLVVACSLPVWAQQTYLYDDRPKISVKGEAVVDVKPDKIVIAFGIQTCDKDIELSKKNNNDILKRAVAAVKQCGIPEKNIQTDYLSIRPEYRNNRFCEDFIGYFVRNTFLVTLGETAKVEELVSKVLAAGVTHIHGIDFQTTEFKKHREQARELALQAAKEKAEKMAAVLDCSIGGPIQIGETYSRMHGGYYSNWGWGSGQFSGMSQNVRQNMRGNSSEISDTIALGKLSIRAAVGVTFELKK